MLLRRSCSFPDAGLAWRPGQTRPEALALRRLIASTLAASSSTKPVTMYTLPRRLVEQAHAVVDHGDHEAAEHRVDDPALAAEEAGAADHGGAHGEQQGQRATGGRGHRVVAAGDAACRRPRPARSTS